MVSDTRDHPRLQTQTEGRNGDLHFTNACNECLPEGHAPVRPPVSNDTPQELARRYSSREGSASPKLGSRNHWAAMHVLLLQSRGRADRSGSSRIGAALCAFSAAPKSSRSAARFGGRRKLYPWRRAADRGVAAPPQRSEAARCRTDSAQRHERAFIRSAKSALARALVAVPAGVYCSIAAHRFRARANADVLENPSL